MISVAIRAEALASGHPSPNVDRIAKEGAAFTCWYGQASCTAGRASVGRF
jgi:arylsulfatase A-like enzyme